MYRDSKKGGVSYKTLVMVAIGLLFIFMGWLVKEYAHQKETLPTPLQEMV